MTKREFTLKLRARLSGLPSRDVEERIAFYTEIIEDKVEEGLSEDAAVEELGSIDEVAAQIAKDVPLINIVKEKMNLSGKLAWWEILLLALGSPIWISLIVAAFAVAISLFAALWSVVISLWAACLALAVGGVGGTLLGAILIFTDGALSGFSLISASLVAGGLSIPAFFGCKALTRGAFILSRESVAFIKKRFIKKER